jgi:hypothetical protein
MLQAELALL